MLDSERMPWPQTLMFHLQWTRDHAPWVARKQHSGWRCSSVARYLPRLHQAWCVSQEWLCTPKTPAVGKERQEETKEGRPLPQSKFKTSLSYRRPCVKNKRVRKYRKFHFGDEETESKRQVPSSFNDFSLLWGRPT